MTGFFLLSSFKTKCFRWPSPRASCGIGLLREALDIDGCSVTTRHCRASARARRSWTCGAMQCAFGVTEVVHFGFPL